MMRMFIVGLLCCSFAVAQDPPKEAPAETPKKVAPVTTVKDGKLTNTAWNLAFEARGLESGIATQDPRVIFSGRAAGGVQIEIRVIEGPKKQDSKVWRDGVMDAWTKAKRKLENVEKGGEGVATVMYTETKLDVFTEEHGFAFYARGYQCFLVHCYVADKTEKSTAKIKGYLGGLKLGEDPGVAFLVMVFASRMGKPMDDPMVLFAAGIEYATGRQTRVQNYPIAAKVLARARKGMKEDTYTAEQKWYLYEMGGMSFLVEPLRDLKTAIEWFTLAEEAGKTLTDESGATRDGGSAYNLACAYSLNGDIEKGYAALHRAFAKALPVDAAHLDKDTDLDNLKKNKELWDKFWKERVAGK
jgi:hypothetical protein